jgi:phenylacetate-CoA oxygenase PaaJ subunit
MVTIDGHAVARQDDDVEAEIWRALGGVMDPEIPVVSIVELGIVRDVRVADERCTITLTPTYSGCPATRVIEDDARVAASKVAPGTVEVRTALAPAWTTDWVAPEARATRGVRGGAAVARRRRYRRNDVSACHSLPAVRLGADRRAVAFRLDAVQGAVSLPRLPRAVRLLQAALRRA